MLPVKFEAANRVIGEPKNWDAEKHGPVMGLPVCDAEAHGYPCMISVWKPTPEEAKRLGEGAPICLRIVGNTHPVVSMYLPEGELETQPITE